MRATARILAAGGVALAVAVGPLPAEAAGDRWGGWSSEGGATYNGPDVVTLMPSFGTNGVSESRAYVIGTNSKLYEAIATGSGSFGSWTQVGTDGTLTSAPSAVSPSSGVVHVFARGTNGAVYEKVRASDGTWGTWTSRGGDIVGSPSAVIYNGVMHVFARGTDNRLYQMDKATGNWSGWSEVLGSSSYTISSSPAAISTGGRLEVYAKRSDDSIWQVYYNGSTWSSWWDMDGTFLGDPTAVATGNGGATVFGTGTNNQVYQRYRESTTGAFSGSWTSIDTVGSVLGELAATTNNYGQLVVLARASNDAIYRIANTPASATYQDVSASKQAARYMVTLYGWNSASEWSCLDSLWTAESGWLWYNEAGSGAYGIPQSLPKSKLLDAGSDGYTNPATQIRWGLGYIHSHAPQFSTPCEAWDYFQANGGY